MVARHRLLLQLWGVATLGFAIQAFARGLLAPARTIEVQPLVIDLNRASVAELQVLPGIGSERARAIVLQRIRDGCFASVQDLLCIDGIGEATLRLLEGHVACSTTAAAEVDG